MLDLVPEDLNVTEAEWRSLHKDVLKPLTGVFWEAVGRDPEISALKEHFYANGILYTTAIDVSLLGGFGGICYLLASWWLGRPVLLGVAILLLSLVSISNFLIVPRARNKHLALSAEQLELLKRRQRQFIQTRFREIVLQWRRDTILCV